MKALAIAAALALGAAAAPQLALGAEDWTTVERSIDVAVPAAKFWAYLGGYCAANKARNAPCDFAQGQGELGSIRQFNPTTTEVKVAEGQYSYGYFQNHGSSAALRYHGNISVLPTGANSSRIVYTLIYDQGALATDAERETARNGYATRFQGAIEELKQLAEAQK